MARRIPRPVLVLAILAVFALGTALGINAFIARKLAVDPQRLAAARSGLAEPGAVATAEPAPEPESPTADKFATPRAPTLASWLDPILRRNLFDSANALAGKPAEESGGPAGELAAPGEDCPTASGIDATLIATSISTRPEFSTALISVAGAVAVYRLDDPVGDGTIRAIDRAFYDWETRQYRHQARVAIDRGGRVECLEVGGASGKASSATKAAPGAEKPAAAGDGYPSLRECGTNKYCISQEDMEKALSSLDKLAREARIVPSFQDGNPNGFKVFAIRRNSVFRQLGLQNNDVLTSVNGLDLTSTEKGLEIYSKLKNDKSFQVELLRNGAPMTLGLDIQ
jgi:hypothetical protein